MCECKHGMDRHFVDYAYGQGMWMGKCLEKGCGCKIYRNAAAVPIQSGILIQGSTYISGSTFIPGSVTIPVGQQV